MKYFADVIKQVTFEQMDKFYRTDEIMKSYIDHWEKCKNGYRMLLENLQTISVDNFIPDKEAANYTIQFPEKYKHPNPFPDEKEYYVDKIISKEGENTEIIDTNHFWLSIPVVEKCFENAVLVVCVYTYEMTFYGFDEKTRKESVEKMNRNYFEEE